jgi:hypothetical protein
MHALAGQHTAWAVAMTMAMAMATVSVLFVNTHLISVSLVATRPFESTVFVAALHEHSTRHTAHGTRHSNR